MNYDKNIEYYLNLIKQERKNVNAELKHCPPGRLIVSHEKRGIRFYCSLEKNGVRKVIRINHDMELVAALARKAYLIDYRKRLDACADAFEDCLVKLRNANPDFIVMGKDGKLIYIEHCGRMDDEKYVQRHKEKLRIYETAGIVPSIKIHAFFARSDATGSVFRASVDM